MADAKRDNNQVTTLLAVSNADGVTPVVLWADPTTHRLLVQAAAGTLAGLTDVTLTTPAQGDILYYDGTVWRNLAHGTSGQFLKTQGAAANPIWANVSATPGGSTTQVQYNNASAFAGSAGFTFDGTSVVTLGVAGTSVGSVAFNNATSGTITLSPVTGALGTVTLSLPAATDTLIGKATTDTLTNKTLDTAGTGNVLKINGTQVSAVTGTGSVVLATSPTLVTPTLGVASATTINKVTLTAPATGSTLTIADGKTLTASNTMTLAAGADGQTWTFPSSSDTVVTLGASQTLTSKTLTTPVINGTSTGTGVSATPTASIIAMWDANKNLSANNLIDGFTTTATAGTTTTMDITYTGTQVWTGSTTQTVKLPTTSVVAGGQYTIINQSTGAVTVQSSGANTILILATGTSAVFTAVVATPTTAANWNAQYLAVSVTSGKKLSVSNTLTLAGTDATTMTFPGASDTVGGLGTAQTWTAQNKFNNIIDVNNAITASGNAATVPVTYRLNTVTNNSAATLTITMATTSAVDGQMTVVRILDATAVAQTISWVNTENSTVSAPTTSNGSTTLFLTVGFIYNAGTSKWRCIASA